MQGKHLPVTMFPLFLSSSEATTSSHTYCFLSNNKTVANGIWRPVEMSKDCRHPVHNSPFPRPTTLRGVSTLEGSSQPCGASAGNMVRARERNGDGDSVPELKGVHVRPFPHKRFKTWL